MGCVGGGWGSGPRVLDFSTAAIRATYLDPAWVWSWSYDCTKRRYAVTDPTKKMERDKHHWPYLETYGDKLAESIVLRDRMTTLPGESIPRIQAIGSFHGTGSWAPGRRVLPPVFCVYAGTKWILCDTCTQRLEALFRSWLSHEVSGVWRWQ